MGQRGRRRRPVPALRPSWDLPLVAAQGVGLVVLATLAYAVAGVVISVVASLFA